MLDVVRPFYTKVGAQIQGARCQGEAIRRVRSLAEPIYVRFGAERRHTPVTFVIRLDEVIRLLEGSVAPVECVNNPSLCDRATLCATRDIWGDLKKAINGVLSSVTLSDLVQRQMVKDREAEELSHI